MKLLTAIATVTAIAVPTLASADEVKHIKFACEGNKTLDAVFINSNEESTAVILQDGELVAMKQASTGSGVRYVPISKDYTYELWGKGDTMNLSVKGGDETPVLQNCKG